MNDKIRGIKWPKLYYDILRFCDDMQYLMRCEVEAANPNLFNRKSGPVFESTKWEGHFSKLWEDYVRAKSEEN
jgi:hypothetical protein